MTLKPILFFGLVGVICATLVYRETQKTGTPGLISIGDAAPDFSIKDQTGRSLRLSDYKGEVVFLNFWATWCGPCVDEAPEIESLHQTFKDRKFRMLTVSNDTNWNDVVTFHANHHLSFPVWLDPGQQVSRYIYRITGWPETFLIDAKGVIVKHTFAAHWASSESVALVQKLIDEAEETP